jgi:hypothetical protein
VDLPGRLPDSQAVVTYELGSVAGRDCGSGLGRLL